MKHAQQLIARTTNSICDFAKFLLSFWRAWALEEKLICVEFQRRPSEYWKIFWFALKVIKNLIADNVRLKFYKCGCGREKLIERERELLKLFQEILALKAS